MRQRYVMKGGKLVPRQQKLGNFQALSDIQPFVTQDGVEITSRSHLREYERSRGVRQVGNDWSGPEKPKWWDNRESVRR